MRSRWLLCALLLGLLARIVFEVQLAPYPRHERMLNALDDQSFFLDWAAAMRHGERLDLSTSPHEWAYWAARQPRLPPQAPLYPALLALLSLLVGSAPAWIRAAQVAVGLATIVGVFLVARSRFGEATAAVAAIAAALYAPWIFFESTVLRTSGLVFFFVSIVVAFDHLSPIERFTERRDRWAACGTGALCGVAVLFQEQFLVLGIAGAIWLALRRRDGARWLLLGGALVLLPPVTWASLSAGRVVASTASGPFNLLLANLHDAGGQVPSTTPSYDAIQRSDSHVPVDLLGALLADIQAHPRPFVHLVTRKIGFLLRPVEIPNNVNFYLGARENTALRWIPFDYPTLLPLALAGLFLAGRRARPAAPLLAFAALYALTLVAFVPLARLRQPLALVVIVFAAAGATEIWRRLKPRQGGARLAFLAPLAIGALLAVGVALRPVHDRQIRPTDWQMAGAAWENEAIDRRARGRLLAARQAFVQSLTRNPAAARVRAALQELDTQLGSASPAPLSSDSETLCEEGIRAAQSGDLVGAQRLLESAARQAPGHPRPWQLLANVLYLRADHEAAATALEKAVAANPYDPLPAANLAVLRGLRP